MYSYPVYYFFWCLIIATTPGSWSRVGSDAALVDPDKPTMTLGLEKGNTDYNKHTTIHEFGHALGLEHEHQRSMFWEIAKKFIDIGAMKKKLSDIVMQRDYLQVKQCGTGSRDYDPDSIMHYWYYNNYCNMLYFF